MADMIYNSFFYDQWMGNVIPGTHSFKLMLVTSTYVPNKDTHTKRSDVTNEITGTGYVAGGAAVANILIAQDNVNDRATWDADDVVWAASTITARGAVLYRTRGGLATLDELVKYFDFVTDKSSSSAPFTVQWDAAGIMDGKDAP